MNGCNQPIDSSPYPWYFRVRSAPRLQLLMRPFKPRTLGVEIKRVLYRHYEIDKDTLNNLYASSILMLDKNLLRRGVDPFQNIPYYSVGSSLFFELIPRLLPLDDSFTPREPLKISRRLFVEIRSIEDVVLLSPAYQLGSSLLSRRPLFNKGNMFFSSASAHIGAFRQR